MTPSERLRLYRKWQLCEIASGVATAAFTYYAFSKWWQNKQVKRALAQLAAGACINYCFEADKGRRMVHQWAGQRRPGPSGATAPLDPATKDRFFPSLRDLCVHQLYLNAVEGGGCAQQAIEIEQVADQLFGRACRLGYWQTFCKLTTQYRFEGKFALDLRAFSDHLDEASLKATLQSFPNLSRIDLRGCHRLTQATWGLLATYTPQLEQIHADPELWEEYDSQLPMLQDYRVVNYETVNVELLPKSLRHLELPEKTRSADERVLLAILDQCSDLQSLHNFSGENKKIFLTVLSKAPNLRSLSLTRDAAAELCHLSLDGEYSLEEIAILSSGCTQWPPSWLARFSKLDTVAFYSANVEGFCEKKPSLFALLIRCPHLTRLTDIKSCYSPENLKLVLDACPKLQLVELWVSDVAASLKLISQYRNVTQVVLLGPPPDSHEDFSTLNETSWSALGLLAGSLAQIETLCHRSPHLEFLAFGRRNDLADHLPQLMSHPLPSITHIALGRQEIGSQVFQNFLKAFPDLRELHAGRLSNIHFAWTQSDDYRIPPPDACVIDPDWLMTPQGQEPIPLHLESVVLDFGGLHHSTSMGQLERLKAATPRLSETRHLAIRRFYWWKASLPALAQALPTQLRTLTLQVGPSGFFAEPDVDFSWAPFLNNIALTCPRLETLTLRDYFKKEVPLFIEGNREKYPFRIIWEKVK